MVSLQPDPNAELEEYSNLSDSDIDTVRKAAKEKVKSAIRNESSSPEFDVMDGENILDKPPYKAESGEIIVYWPPYSDGLNSDVSNVDTDALESYFSGGYGVGFLVQ